MSIRVVSLFSGVGAPEMALKNIGLDFKVVAVCEINKYSHKSYEAIHGHTLNLGDITKVDSLPECDLLTWSFPCTTISIAGKQEGMVDGKASGLVYEVLRLIQSGHKPKFLLMENVKALIGKKFIKEFQEICKKLETIGYKNSWKVLNSKDFGVPQNRERVFMVSEFNGTDDFSFPEGSECTSIIDDILENTVDQKYYLSDKILAGLKYKNNGCSITNGNFNGCIKAKCGAIRGRQNTAGVWEQTLEIKDTSVSNTITTVQKDNLVVTDRIRNLTPRETWRLMGFSDQDFDKAKAVNSDSQLYKQAGNSIVVPVLEAIFSNFNFK